MPGQIKPTLEVFPLLAPSLSVGEARVRLKEAADQQGINVGYGVVVDAAGLPLACLNTTRVADWPERQTLESLRAMWPAVYTLSRAQMSMNDAGLYLVARFFQEEIDDEDFVGIVLLDEAGKASAILRKRVLTDIFAGIHRRSVSGERPSLAIAGIPAEGELQVKRYAHLRFPARVQLYQRCQLAITIRRNPPEDGTQPWELGLRRKDWPLNVVATLLFSRDQPDFRVEGPRSGAIEVPQNADSGTLTFTLIPQSLGSKKLRILFEQNGAHLCVTEVLAEVIQAEPTTTTLARVSSIPQIIEESRPPNVTIHIENVRAFVYDVRVRTLSDPPGSELRLIDQIVFQQRPDTYLESWFQVLNEKHKTGLTPETYDREVKKIGEHLFLDFLHDDPEDSTRRFQRFYWQEMHPLPEGSYVQIVSDEPYIPWEILRPRRMNEDGSWDKGEAPFLCQRFALTRWLYPGQNGPVRLNLQKIALVAPASQLEWVQPEVDAISRLGKVTKIEDLPQLEAFLQHGQADVLHFACHGKFQSADPARSIVVLGDSPFHPWDLTPDFRYFGSKHPLVFMNACDSGREGIGLAGLDGWATAFVRDARAGFFIGSVWRTTDELACKFAEVFYDSLQHGYSIGEAARVARKAIEVAGDATCLSYTVYANPCASL